MTKVAKECLRVIKPGGHALVWSIPRTSHWTGISWEQAGWEPRDKIYHAFGTGFPKSLDISKTIDKMAGAERKVIGKITEGRAASPRQDIRRGNFHACSEGDTRGYDGSLITAPATDEAKKWDGWGTALKPAVEEWWLFRKSLEGTVAENVLQYGTGGINIKECRIPINPEVDNMKKVVNRQPRQFGDWKDHSGYKNENNIFTGVSKNGRWPANLVHDGSEEVVNLFPNCVTTWISKDHVNNRKGEFLGKLGHPGDQGFNDSGSAARFFYCAKASRAEREAGCEDLSDKQMDESRKEGNPGGDNPRNRGVTKFKNNHPAVKALSLMRYLCKLITPPNGIVLDPFMGSGSTGIACKLEGFNFKGIDNDPSSVEIARARISYYDSFNDPVKKVKKKKEKVEKIVNPFLKC